jgi:hypothetical protein
MNRERGGRDGMLEKEDKQEEHPRTTHVSPNTDCHIPRKMFSPEVKVQTIKALGKTIRVSLLNYWGGRYPAVSILCDGVRGMRGEENIRDSIHLMASVSLTLPRYRWVVARLACRRLRAHE